MARSMKVEAEQTQSRRQEKNTCDCGVVISDAEILCSDCKAAVMNHDEKARAAYAGATN